MASTVALLVVGEYYLEGVLDAVSRLSDPDSFQHTCVSELSEHQAVIETQRQLRGREREKGGK